MINWNCNKKLFLIQKQKMRTCTIKEKCWLSAKKFNNWKLFEKEMEEAEVRIEVSLKHLRWLRFLFCYQTGFQVFSVPVFWWVRYTMNVLLWWRHHDSQLEILFVWVSTDFKIQKCKIFKNWLKFREILLFGSHDYFWLFAFTKREFLDFEGMKWCEKCEWLKT